MNRKEIVRAAKAPLKIFDYIIFGIIVIACILAFQGLSVWNIVSGVVYVACGVLAYYIAMEIGMGRKKSKLCSYAVLTMPIGVYCQFILGSSEVLLLFLVLVGFYFWLKEADKPFIAYFAVAIGVSWFAFFIFIVLLVLKKKNVKDIAISVCLALIPILIWTVIYLVSGEYMLEKANLVNLNMYGSTIQLGGMEMNVTIFLSLCVIFYAYGKTVAPKEERVKWALYLIGLQLFAIFGLGSWEPQYLLLMVPFFTFSAFINKETKIFMALDMLLMLFFALFVVNEFCGVADETLFVNGIWGEQLAHGVINKKQMKDVMIYQDKGVILSFFSVLMLIMAVFKHPDRCLRDVKEAVEKGTVGFIRARFLVGIACFLLPAAVCLMAAFRPPYVTLYMPETYDNIGYMTSGRQNSEVFIATKGELHSVEFCVGTYERDNDIDVLVKIVDATTEQVLFSETVNMSGYGEYDWVYVDTNGLQLTPGGTYRLDIVSPEAEAGNCITVYRTQDLCGQTHAYAYIDGQRQDYHLCVKIIEDNL